MPGPKCAGAHHILKVPDAKPLDGSTAQKRAELMLEGPARYCCLAGGTRSGKTFLIVRAIVQRAVHHPDSRHAILRFRSNAAKASIAQYTLPHVNETCFPGVLIKEHKVDGFFSLNNGARITVGGLDDHHRVEKILGLEYASVFLNEASQIPYQSALIAFTRLAQVVPNLTQRAYVDLNPTSKTHWTNVLFGEKRDPVSRQLLADPDAYARAFLNPSDNAANLTPAFLASLAALPERQRRRFYEGVYVDEVDDALWSYEVIDKGRCEPTFIERSERKRIVVGVDPSGARDRHHDADETGIVVAALDRGGDAYILADRSIQDRPEVWAERAVTAYHEFNADAIIVETNFGGDMARATIHARDPNVMVKTVSASRGKAVRAAPISVRYAQGKVHHIERFPKLEEQLCAFTAGGYHGEASPDRADAAIWALTALFEGLDDPSMIEFYSGLTKSPAP